MASLIQLLKVTTSATTDAAISHVPLGTPLNKSLS